MLTEENWIKMLDLQCMDFRPSMLHHHEEGQTNNLTTAAMSLPDRHWISFSGFHIKAECIWKQILNGEHYKPKPCKQPVLLEFSVMGKIKISKFFWEPDELLTSLFQLLKYSVWYFSPHQICVKWKRHTKVDSY